MASLMFCSFWEKVHSKTLKFLVRVNNRCVRRPQDLPKLNDGADALLANGSPGADGLHMRLDWAMRSGTVTQVPIPTIRSAARTAWLDISPHIAENLAETGMIRLLVQEQHDLVGWKLCR